MQKIKSLLFASLLLTVNLLQAQPVEGEITYDHTTHWARIYSGLSYLSQEEKDRIKLTWGTNDAQTTEMSLKFTPEESLYTHVSRQGQTPDGRYTWKNPEYIVYRDLKNGLRDDRIEMLGRLYHVEDSIRAPQWKVMNKIKDIQGYICMMATTTDTIKNQEITAWFAGDLPASVGPGMFYGLPGAILELEINDGEVVITAKKIALQPVGQKLRPGNKVRGRKVDSKTYNKLIADHVGDSVKARRNPYWSMPF